MIENILILDTETTGLWPEKGAKLIEIGLILFNIKYKSVLQSYATLLPCETNPVENINHIKVAATQCNFSLALIDSIIKTMAECADACIAHNAEFDKKFIATIPVGEKLLDMKWICTKANFTWPISLQSFRLEDICNGMKVPYINAHRALVDCLFIAQCFEKVEDLEERINRC